MAGANMKAIKSRIKSVESTRQITKAMELVASSKLRRAKQQEEAVKPYYSMLLDTIRDIVRVGCEYHPLINAKPDATATCYIVIAGDRGLAGGYNANVFRLAKEYQGAEFIPIGKRSCDRFGGDLYIVEHFSPDEAWELSKKLCRDFKNGEFDRLGILATKYVSMLTQEAYIKWILPLKRSTDTPNQSVLFEPDELSILNIAILEYVSGMIVAAARESFASEVAARRCAMDSAGKNAQEMIDELQLEYNSARQSAITQEITEIVAGCGT